MSAAPAVVANATATAEIPMSSDFMETPIKDSSNVNATRCHQHHRSVVRGSPLPPAAPAWSWTGFCLVQFAPAFPAGCGTLPSGSNCTVDCSGFDDYFWQRVASTDQPMTVHFAQ
jgi:hypothetical protein